MFHRARPLAVYIHVFPLPASGVITESWHLRLTFSEESEIPKGEPGFDLPLRPLGSFAGADLLGLAPAVVANKNPPRAFPLSDLHAHPVVPISSFTIPSTSTAAMACIRCCSSHASNCERRTRIFPAT